MSMIIFKLREAQARYSITNKDLADLVGVGNSAVSEWRSGNKSPTLQRVNQIMKAIEQLAEPKQLELYPLKLSELIEWRSDTDLS